MSITRSACPGCRRVFRVPEDVLGKHATCPNCKRLLVVRASGGKMTLELAGISPNARTERYDRSTEGAALPAETSAILPAPVADKPRTRTLVLSLLVLMSLLMLCGGVATMIWKKVGERDEPRSEVREERERAPEAKETKSPTKRTPESFTPEQRAVWAKIRRRYQEKAEKPDEVYGLVVFPTNGETWLMLGFAAGDNPWRHELPRYRTEGFNAVNFGFVAWDRQAMQQQAEETAKDPRWLACAVVDLVGGEQPAIVEWYSEDGNGVHVSLQAPLPSLKQKGLSFLHELVADAGRL